ncbi:MAG TPA: hypothetical protein VM680_04135 [Verrucomicrobiae bacterium]|nr:hypothetical protein [Verrucomicrobiae bacterium]
MKVADAIQFRIVARGELSQALRAQMFQLLCGHFTNVSAEQFSRDLAEKQMAIRLERAGELVGFSTLRAFTTQCGGEEVNLIYSGDTIVTPSAWGSMALPRAWVAGVEELKATLPPRRCFWLLLTSGFRTYRFLPVFWREFFPRFDAVTPADAQQRLDQFANELFGPQFDAANGIVRFQQPQMLRNDLQQIPAGRESDPHVAFFLSRNPGFVHGDELVTITEISDENLTAAGKRIVRANANRCIHS